MGQLVREQFVQGDVVEDIRSQVDCRICGSTTFSPYFNARGHQIVRCSECGLWYVNPQPSNRELSDFYADFDRESLWRGDGEERFDRGVRRIIRRIRREGAVLDIGCSRGNLLVSMRSAGFSVYGVEPSPKNSDFARTNNGIRTFTGTVEQFLSTSPKERFDIITLMNVLEHLRDPKQVLTGLRALLVDDGLIALVVPDARLHAVIGSVRAGLGVSDPFWMNTQKHPLVGFDPPPHLCSFTPKTITLLLERSGFRRVKLCNAPPIFNQDRWKNTAKILLHAFAKVLCYTSLGQIVVGYSTLVIGQKTSGFMTLHA
jgi:2-polyprenyl-3-methyl-5-hydroxy-6-metoxy-1,4-benzoquinol methylase